MLDAAIHERREDVFVQVQLDLGSGLVSIMGRRGDAVTIGGTIDDRRMRKG